MVWYGMAWWGRVERVEWGGWSREGRAGGVESRVEWVEYSRAGGVG